MDVKDSVKDLLRRTSVEFMGTFYLVFFVGLTSQLTDSTSLQFVGAFVPGLTLMTLVFLGGHLSLGSYNPAVTLALTLRPALLSWRACLCYIVAELLGGIFGALTAWGFGGDVVPAFGSKHNMGVIFFAEFFGSFLLVMTVLNAGTSANNEGNSFYGLAIGGSLVVSALVFGNISGAVLNPAVGMLALFGFVHEGKGVPAASWVFFVAPMVASGCAALVFRHQSPRDHAPREALMRGPVDHPEHHVRGSEVYEKVLNPMT